jgi:hypothetical protein
MVAAPTLVGASSVLERKVAIRPWRYNSYAIVPNLWGGLVAPPASLKSNAIEEAIRPVKRLAATAHDRFQSEIAMGNAHFAALEAETEGLKARMKQASKQASKQGQDTRDLEALLGLKYEELESARPIERRYWVADSTPENLADFLKENPNGLLVVYDELSGWLADMDKQGREGSRAFALAAWERTGDFYVDRILRGSNYIPAVCLSVIGGIQPDRLKRYVDEALSGGNGGDGLLQRFQVLIYIDNLGQWKAPDT